MLYHAAIFPRPSAFPGISECASMRLLPCTGPCSQHQLGGGPLILITFQTGRNICASTTFLDRSIEQDRSCRLQGMSKMHPARLSVGFSSDCFARATATRAESVRAMHSCRTCGSPRRVHRRDRNCPLTGYDGAVEFSSDKKRRRLPH